VEIDDLDCGRGDGPGTRHPQQQEISKRDGTDDGGRDVPTRPEIGGVDRDGRRSTRNLVGGQIIEGPLDGLLPGHAGDPSDGSLPGRIPRRLVHRVAGFGQTSERHHEEQHDDEGYGQHREFDRHGPALTITSGFRLGLRMLNIGDFARLGQVSPRTLRHYDQLGLLRPDRVDRATGYRSYGVAQLVRLHRLLALRDLGFSLEQISGLLDDDPPVEQLRGMLRLRQAQIEHTLADEHARLRRVDAHLRALEGSNARPVQNVVIKHTQPLRVIESAGTAPGFGPDLIGPLFAQLLPEVLAHLGRAGARPGICVGYYEVPAEDGSVVVHAGFDIGDQEVNAGGAVKVVDLPIIEVAALVHEGSIDGVEPVYESLFRWIDDSGYQLAGRSRELYLEWHDDNPDANITELQMPIAR
jgi:DNA-binding transcriptional MerR regulator